MCLICAHQDAVLKELHSLINNKPDLLLYKYFIRIFRLTDSIDENAPYKSIAMVYKQAKSTKVVSFKDHSLFINNKENLRECVFVMFVGIVYIKFCAKLLMTSLIWFT